MQHTVRILISLDLLSAYFQLAVAPEDQRLLTFLLPTGKYRFLKLPMGWLSSQDYLCERTQCLLTGITGIQSLMDDFLIFAGGVNEAYHKALQLLMNAVLNGWIFSNRKFRVSTKVEFCGLGLEATQDGQVVISP